jgi:hypothetical protein
MKPTIESRKPFDRRAFTVLGASLTGIGLPVTGIMNHLYQHDPTSVSLHAWMPAHWILGFLFMFFVIWHLILNSRALGKHFRGIIVKRILISREAFCAVSIVVFFLLVILVGHTIHD